MSKSESKRLTRAAKAFLVPRNPTHRQYEALRAYFVEGLAAKEAAARFGYTPGSFRVLCHQFRQDPDREFFLGPAKGPQTSPKKDSVREQVVALRKQNLSIYDIARVLEERGQTLSAVSIASIVKEEGFARLTRRGDEERAAGTRPTDAAVADVRHLDLSPRHVRTSFGGLFLFLPYLAQLGLDRLVAESGLPGTKMIPAGHAVRALLGLKLFGSARHRHVMSVVFDEGLALWAGLNAIPKRSLLTEYSCRIDPACYPKLMARWFDAMHEIGLTTGTSFDLDFHTIPFHGEDALLQKHYVSKRSRRQKGLLAFLAQDADKRFFCYGNAQVRKEDQNDEILRFVAFWQARTGRLPEELVFDSRLTTYSNLNHLNQQGIRFMTLRRRTPQMIAELYRQPASAWRRTTLDSIARAYRTPRILDRQIELKDYDGPLREIAILELGHEEPTLLLTNQLKVAPSKLIGRYAQRLVIENGIADGIDFFHFDALSSAVAMKVNCDVLLTLMGSSLYRLLGTAVGNGYATAKPRHLFRDFAEATAQITIAEEEVVVAYQKRAHNPLLIAAGLDKTAVRIPWLGNKQLRLVFG
jgi:transposase